MHQHNFVYNAKASTPGTFVTICSGCGEVKVNQLAKAPPLIPTEIPGVWDVPSRFPPRRRPYPNPFDNSGMFRKVID